MKNRIKELREARGLTQKDVAEALGDGTTYGTISKLENDYIPLNTEWLDRLAPILGVADAVEIIDDRAPLGFLANIEPLADIRQETSETQKIKGEKLATEWVVLSNDLEEIGIVAGSYVEVDQTPAAVRGVAMGDVVVAIIPSEPEGTEAMVMRQFVEPALLITNAREKNATPINMRTTQARIVGVVTNVRRQLRRSKTGT